MMKTKKDNLAMWYTRLIGIFFILVAVSLVLDYSKFGFRPETMHKLFHVILGILIIIFGWSNEKFWGPFAIANGAFFTYVAIFGWIFPNFGGLDTFNLLDTILHSIVGISGLVIGIFFKKDKEDYILLKS